MARICSSVVLATSLLISFCGAAEVDAEVADSNTAIGAVVDELRLRQRVRIRTNDYRVLGGYFIGARRDSLYLESSSRTAGEERERLAENAIGLSQIEFMWTIDQHGWGRGSLWAGGVLLVGGWILFEAGDDTLGEVGIPLVFAGTIAVATFAFYKGATGTKETLVYSRYAQ